jgi:hypothetical protein
MNTLFRSTQYRILALFSGISAVAMLLFIAREVESLRFLIVTSDTSIFSLVFFLCGVGVFATTAFYFNANTSWRSASAAILITFFPAALLLIFALTKSRAFHYVFQLAADGYVLCVGLLLIAVHHAAYSAKTAKTEDREHPTKKHWFASQRKLTLGLLAFVVSINLGFGVFRLADAAVVDEALWTFGKRISKYWTNMAERDWKGTRVSDKPGVTVAIISGAGLLSENPKDYKPMKLYGEATSHPKNDIRNMNFALRLPLVFFAACSLFFLYFFLERLLDDKKALLSVILVGTSPILLGMERIINPDAILWVFSTLTLTSYLAFLRYKRLPYLYWAGIFMGLSLLTKYVANILFVFFFGVIFLEYIFQKEKERRSSSFAHFFKQSFLHYVIFTGIAIAVFFILYPVTWVKPAQLLDATLLSQAFNSTWPFFIGILAFLFLDQWLLGNRVTQALLEVLADGRHWIVRFVAALFFGLIVFVFFNVFSDMRWYDFEAMLASPKTSYKTAGFLGVFLGNFYPLIFGIHAIALAALVGVTGRVFIRAKHLTRSIIVTFYGIIFIMLYYLGSTVNHVATISRYQIMLFPIALILAGIGLASFVHRVGKRFPMIPFHAYAFALVGICVFSLVSMRPFLPLGYASIMLPKEYILDIKDMGDGSFEAAHYLNTLENARNITIWTDKNGVCQFFVGNCYDGFSFSKLRKIPLDYIVVSSGRANRTGNMTPEATDLRPDIIPFDTYYQTKTAVWELHIDGRPKNFVKIIPYEKPL